MRSFVPMLKKSTSRASRSAVTAALGVSSMIPSGTPGSCATPSAARSARTLAQIASARSELVGARHERQHEAHRARRRRAIERAELRAEDVRSLEGEPDRANAERGVGPLRHPEGGRELVAAEVQRSERHGQPPDGVQHRERVAVLLVLGRQVRAFEVQELRAKEADPLGARCGHRRDAEQRLDVGAQMNPDAVGRQRGEILLGEELRVAQTLGRGARAVGLQRLLGGIDDDVTARPVDDDDRARRPRDRRAA